MSPINGLMPFLSQMLGALGLLICLVPTLAPAQAPAPENFLSNADFKNRLQGWRGEATIAYLKADGTEGNETDADVTPVLKLKLARNSPRLVSHSYNTGGPLADLKVQVEVYTSQDFVRSKEERDFSRDGIGITPCDFWILGSGSPGYFIVSYLKPGQWTTAKGIFRGLPKNRDQGITFFGPPGTGTIYLKNPRIEK